ncbi:SAM-dependent methyltransferase [Rhizobium halophytocola]|uniref:Cyclopropane-fatty-acyl-phospholipid synthase n=1 Tax=Rhizobium halophytocola TaxID=735519 RepID=A0ABS4E0I6_9HYPH|nr:cyclopropane-fatty-acyl-phospholipid synthase family protein [Rhizobium halophytocola]MBP1851446.1 cyclopropane-fatty-acyl-phospholipid synthase [Rhizobium halophytocola]
MNLHAIAINAVERNAIPDSITRAGIEYLVGRTKRRLAKLPGDEEVAFALDMGRFPIATHTDEANQQHYEVPAEFFARVLGPRRKYSSCFYPDKATTLEQAELHALAETVAHAGIEDGQTILELGCGWGSLSLYMAESFPHARITSVSNSASQRRYIEQQAADKGLTNLTIVTADMNDFSTDTRHDRVVSVEMFEHMSNWQELLVRTRSWLKPEGRLFLHVFTHRNRSYRFDHNDPADWIANYFFTGGIMPAHDLPHRFPELFHVEQEWRWSGEHYRRTALDWLANFDSQTVEIDRILEGVYGKADAVLWRRRWRLFFLATAGLFGHAGGDVWGVGHYLLAPNAG